MRIVDDDVGWSSIAAVPEKEEEEDEGDMPVVSARERPGRWWGEEAVEEHSVPGVVMFGSAYKQRELGLGLRGVC